MAFFSKGASALDRARAKAYVRLLPLLFLSYAIAYVDRINVSLAKLKMRDELPGFDNAVVGFGAGIFFIGYFILEIPGTLLVERWSARKWISRIMVSWGIVAALTAFVHYRVPGITHLAELTVGGTASFFESVARSNHGWLSQQSESIVAWLKEPGRPFVLQFFSVRFLLGLAEAGFFPGVIVYLSHWFPARDRARALSWFFIATPVAQIVSPKISYFLLRMGTTETVGNVAVQYPAFLGMQGWQWMYIAWGIPAVILGFLVLFKLPDWPRDAALAGTRRTRCPGSRVKQRTSAQASPHESWHGVPSPQSAAAGCGLLFRGVDELRRRVFLAQYSGKMVRTEFEQPDLGGDYSTSGWAGRAARGRVELGSDRRAPAARLGAHLPGRHRPLGCALIPASFSFNQRLALAILLFTGVLTGVKAYMPAFWALPNLLLTESAAAGSIGLINSVGNLGGFVGPFVLGYVESQTNSFVPGLMYLSVSMIISATIVLTLGVGNRTVSPKARGGRRYGNTRLGRGRARRDHRAGVTRAH